MTALMLAAQEGDTEIAKLFIDKGTDLEVKNIKGSTALIIAASNGQSETAKMLIDRGADAIYAIVYLEGSKETDAATGLRILKMLREGQNKQNQNSPKQQ